MENNNTISAWDFVEKFYPNYQSSNQIAHSDDLQKLLDDDYTDGDDADELLQREYGGDLNNKMIQHDFNEVMIDIYEKAIENYLIIQKLKL